MNKGRRVVGCISCVVISGAIGIVLVVILGQRMSGNAPIEFYGRVLDQSGLGIPGTKVSADVLIRGSWSKGTRYVFMSAPSTTRRLSTVTDSNGAFRFQGADGVLLHQFVFDDLGGIDALMFTDEYSDRSFGFGESEFSTPVHHPDKNQPRIFRVWRDEVSPEYVVWRTWIRPISGEKKIALASTLLANEDRPEIQVQCKVTAGDKWAVSIRAVNGDLCETTGREWGDLPRDGWEREYKYSYDASGWRGGSDMLTQRLYYRSYDRKVCAGIVLTLTTQWNRSVRCTWIANTTGSERLKLPGGFVALDP